MSYKWGDYMNFFEILNDLKMKISNFRNDLISKEMIVTSSSDIYELNNEVKLYLDEISKKGNTYKTFNIVNERNNIFNIKNEISLFFTNDINFLNFLKETLIKVSSNKYSNDFKYENELLKKCFEICDLNDKIYDIEKRSKLVSTNMCILIGGKLISRELTIDYDNLLEEKNELVSEYDEINKKLVRNNISSNLESNVLRQSFDDDINFYKDELNKILNYSKKRRNKWIKIDGNKFHIPREFSQRFIYLYNVIKDMEFQKGNTNNTNLLVNNISFISNNNNSNNVYDNCNYVGSISVDDDSVYYKPSNKVKISNESNMFYGTIKVDNNDDNMVIYNYSNKHHTNIKQISSRKGLFDILGRKKSKDKTKVKRNIIKSTVAIVLSLVTSLSVVSLTKLVGSSKSDIDSVTVKTKVNDSTNSNNKDIGINRVKEVMNNNNKENTTYSNNSNVKSSILEKDVTNNNLVKKDNNVKKDTINNNVLKNDDINIGDKIVIVDNSNTIYSSFDDAINDVNGLNPYYGNDLVRDVDYVALNYKGDITYCYTQEEVDSLKNMGATVEAVCTSIDNQVNEGYYRVKQLKKVS